ncbi:hypothetical protein BVG79_01832 [Ketogulonicigenium robustum]|uniref:DUF4174 domain-containing protein n=1 Tax=Ketogulonicigenium robustum TaxID=92947 RepID=A0A1W6P159_9RHOB|nr:DUF4174 domain-containing protein [Ketogulonicigenium robustum]ARO15174.1 hypothetical protein BVG79_01832 [Ketogulonicigenium robustum]
MDIFARRPAALLLALIGALWGAAPLQAQILTPTAIAIAAWEEDRTIVIDAEGLDMAELAYVARLLVVFADSAAQPQFQRQLELLAEDPESLAIRDVMVIADTRPADGSAIRRQLRPRGFSLVLVEKDGRVELRKADPWNLREIARQIDKMPLRIQEINNALGRN